MDSQDQRKSTQGHESHGVHLCHQCGWPFPNPHPSAKHRRAHKRICGTIEGYKLFDSTHSAVSDDENGSDEDGLTPSPKIAKTSSNEVNIGGVSTRSNRSEDEVFADAVTEFSDNRFSPFSEVRLEGVKVFDKKADNVVEGDLGTDKKLEVDATSGIQLPDNATDSSQSQMHNPKVFETEINLLGSAMPIEDLVSSCNSDSTISSDNRTEELAVGLRSVNGSADGLSNIKSETLIDLPKQDGKENVGDQEMQSSKTFLKQGTDVKGNEESNVDEILSDVAIIPSKTTNEASEVACKLQDKDLKSSDSFSVNQILEPKEEESHEMGSMIPLDALSPDVKSCEPIEILVNTAQTESCSVQNRDVDFHVLSVADIPLRDLPERMIKGFKDHNYWKSKIPVTIDSGEVSTDVDAHVLSVENDIPARDLPEHMIGGFKDQNNFKSNFPVTLESGEVLGDGDIHEFSVANDITARDLPERMIEDFEDPKIFKSNFPMTLDSGEVSDADVHVLSVANDIPARDLPELMIEGFEDHKASKSNLPITLDSGEVSGDVDVHVLSVANDIPTRDLPEHMIGGFKDQKKFKSNFPVTLESGEVLGDGDIHELSVANDITARDLPERMIEDFEDPKIFKSNFSVTLDSGEVSDADVHVLSVANDIPARDLPELMIEGFEDHKASKSNLPITLDSGEVSGDVDVHVLSVANDIPVRDLPECMIEGFKDQKYWKSNLPVTLGSGEVIRSAVDDNEDTVYEGKHSGFSPVRSSESTLVSSAELHALESNPRWEDGGNGVLGAEVPVEKGADTSDLKFSSQDLGSNTVEAPETANSGKIQTDSHVEGKEPRDLGLSDVNSVAISDEVGHQTNLSDLENNKNDYDKEELSTNIETSSVSVDNLSVPKAGNSGEHERAGTEFSDLVGNEGRVVSVSKTPVESACSLSDSKLAVDDEMCKVMKNLQGGETTSYIALDSSEVGPDATHLGTTATTHSDLQDRDREDSQEAMKEPLFNSLNEVSNHDSGVEVSQKMAEMPPEHFPEQFTMKSSASIDDSHHRDGGLGASGINTENLQEEGEENLTKQPIEVPAVNVSLDSGSQTESLEGTWGSVSGSVLSTQSDAVPAIDAEALPPTVSEAPAQSEKVDLQNPEIASEGHHYSKSDTFEPPSFMTLVEPQNRVDQKAASSNIQTELNAQQPKSEALQAGWFPSLTNVVNESQGRKKNEEIIAKVTNWSPAKQHTPLKSLLGEANHEAKQPKQTLTVTKKDESTTTVNSILGSKAPADQVAKREMGKEWNSPARYTPDNKKEKRKVKGRPYWIPFICCSSVN